MPELPEVETTVRWLKQAGAEGAVISGVRVLWPRSVRSLGVRTFCRRLKGCRIARVQRRGKWIWISLDSDRHLFIHLRMSGRLTVDTSRRPAPHDRVLLHLEDGRTIHFMDTRKFGRMVLTEHPEEVTAHLGPEPLETRFTVSRLQRICASTSRVIKAVLLDQHKIAGLGNIYADESLWRAGIHPATPADRLTEEQIRKLRVGIRHVLRKAIRAEGTSLGLGRPNYVNTNGRPGNFQYLLKVYGRAGTPCRHCGAVIEKTVMAQRTTHFCPACQPNIS